MHQDAADAGRTRHSGGLVDPRIRSIRLALRPIRPRCCAQRRRHFPSKLVGAHARRELQARGVPGGQLVNRTPLRADRYVTIATETMMDFSRVWLDKPARYQAAISGTLLSCPAVSFRAAGPTSPPPRRRTLMLGDEKRGVSDSPFANAFSTTRFVRSIERRRPQHHACGGKLVGATTGRVVRDAPPDRCGHLAV